MIYSKKPLRVRGFWCETTIILHLMVPASPSTHCVWLMTWRLSDVSWHYKSLFQCRSDIKQKMKTILFIKILFRSSSTLKITGFLFLCFLLQFIHNKCIGLGFLPLCYTTAAVPAIFRISSRRT